MRKLFMLVLFMLILCSCNDKKRTVTPFSVCDKILEKHNNSLDSLQSIVNSEEKKAIVINFFSEPYIIKEKSDINSLEEYFEFIYNSNVKINRRTFDELKAIVKSNKNLSSEELLKINENIASLDMLLTLLAAYDIETNMLIMKLGQLVELKKTCKYEYKNNKLLFYDDTCLKKYNVSESEINKKTDQVNKIMISLIPGKDMKQRVDEFENYVK